MLTPKARQQIRIDQGGTAMFGTSSLWLGALAGVVCVTSVVRAVDLTGLQTSQTDIQAALRARPDCLAWYSFGEVPEGLTFVPAPEKDTLAQTAGSFEGQRATRVFHGKLTGKTMDIPDTGFTLCCWLKVNGLEKVDRGGYKRTGGGLMAYGSGYYNGWRLLASPDAGSISFALGRPEGSRGLSSAGFFTPGEWHHVAVTWDHETLTLWIDGVARAETATTMAYNPATTHKVFRIGECDEGTGVLDFEIADLGFFSTALPGTDFEGLGNPNALFERRLTAFLADVGPPPHNTPVRDPLGIRREREYRERFSPLLSLTGCEGSKAFRETRSYARRQIAQSLLRSGETEQAAAAFRQLAEDDTAMLVHRARAMLALGDMRRDQRDYTGARREYEKMKTFFVAKHEAFRVEAIARLRDIETLADGEPFRNERQRRIDRIDSAIPWFHVSPTGDDDNPGTAERPFQSLERARDAVRERRGTEPLPAGGVAVVLHGGVYPRTSQSFTLGAEDSGTAEAPVVYRAAPGERPILRAGRSLTGFVPLVDTAASRRIPEAARKQVLQIDLRAAGISDFGTLRPRGRDYFGKLVGPDEPAHLELFFNGVPMSLARWPNDTPKMSERFANVELGDRETVRDGPRVLVKNTDTFFYSNPRQDAWAAEPDPWLFGYWQYAFFSSYRRIAEVDPDENRIRIDWNLAPGSNQKPNLVRGSGYQGINLLCELDSPGEWYLDRESGVLYFWPPSAIDGAEIVVSMLEEPVVQVDGASHVVFRGLTLEAGRQHGVVVNDGEEVVWAGCVFRDMGCTAVNVNGGRAHALIGCDLAHLGDAGAKLSGGDLPTLTSSEHVVENCHIHHYAHWNRGAYQPGIQVKGVGVRMSHNLIHDAPHQAILLGGNDHVTEYCEIHDVAHEAGDAGAWYMYGGGGAALSERGNVVLHNYWHHLPYNETFKKYHCVSHMGVYIDNVNGGVTVYGNLFSRFDGPSGAVFFGGSDDIVENNVFHRCFSGINMNDRSWVYGKAYKSIDAFNAKMKVTEPPWSVRYPRLSTIKPETEKFIYGSATTMRYARIERNWEKGDPGLRDPDNGDFRPKPDAPIFAACLFEPLPLEKMGLYNDELRASWPVHHPSGNHETLYVDTSNVDKDDRKPVAKLPVCRPLKRTAEIRIDGMLDDPGWDGLDAAQGYALAKNPANETTKARPSTMWLRRDDACLYIALRNTLAPGQQPRPKGAHESWWGGADMVEVIFEGQGGDWWPADKGHGPLFYLVGDCAGAHGSYAVAGLPESRADGLGGAVQYAAASEPGAWTAEWRIPLDALGLDPEKTKGCCFNVGVHKPRTEGEAISPNDKWAVWVGTQGSNWQVWNAGRLALK
jgi:hypothetical protein